MNPFFLPGVTLAGGSGFRLRVTDPPPRWHRPLGMACAALLAAVFHGGVLLWYMNRPEAPPLSQAQPLPMIDVVLTAPAAPAAAPLPRPPAPKMPESVKKPDPKPVKKVRPKPVHKAEAARPSEPERPAAPSEPAAAPAASTSAPQGHAAASPRREIFTPARSNPNYLSNPRPVYPNIARTRHWEGLVLLRVHVTPEGLCDEVTVQRSSGHEVLDESAMAAVKKWRFVAARRGDIPEASWVTVPIDFTLE